MDTVDTNINQEVSIRELTEALLASKLLVVSVTLIFACGAMCAAFIVPKKYEASIVVSPVANNATGGMLGGLASVASQFSGLASMAGISPQGDSKKSESLAVLQSEALTEKYVQQHDLLPVLYASRWDAENKKWKTSRWKKPPTLWTANLLFKDKIRSVTTDAKTGLTTMKITWTDPILAAQWANDLVRLTNDFLRDKAIAESERNVTFLTAEAKRTDVVGIQQAIYSVLQTEINNVMLARGNDEYALKVVDPAFAPEKPTSPIPALWATLGAIAGFIAACVIVFLKKK